MHDGARFGVRAPRLLPCHLTSALLGTIQDRLCSRKELSSFDLVMLYKGSSQLIYCRNQTISLAMASWCLVVWAIIVAAAAPAWALDSTQAVTQYGHRVWRVGEAGLDHEPSTIAQTSDGQIWIGSSGFLYRFDGKQFAPWRPAEVSESAPLYIIDLLAAKDGSLYVGSRLGLSRISKAGYQRFPQFANRVDSFLAGNNGNVWIGDVHPPAKAEVCEIQPGGLKCYGPRDGIPCVKGSGIAVGPDSDLWLGGAFGICRWSPGHRAKVYRLGDLRAPVTALAFDMQGTLWAGVSAGSPNTGVWSFKNNEWKRFSAPGFDGRRLDVQEILADRSGALWIGTYNRGLYHIADGRVDHFDHLDGLSGDTINYISQDHEGSIWAATTRGLDQFFERSIVRYTAREGLSSDTVNSLTAAPDGAVFLSEAAAIDPHLSNKGKVSVFTTAVDNNGNTEDFCGQHGPAVARQWFLNC